VKIESKWELVKLEDVIELISGQSPESEFYNQEKKGIPFYQGKTEFGEIYLEEPKYWTEKITKESLKGDVLMTVRAPVGPVNINPFERICIGRGLNAMRVSDKILNVYLFYYLKSNQEQITGNEGAIFQSISRDQVLTLKIPLPPLDIQQKIVSEIEVLEAKEKKAKEEVEKLKFNISSSMVNLKFKEINLGSISDFKNGLNYSRNSLGELINIVGVSDFQNRFSPDVASLEKIQIEGNLSDDYLLKTNDILVVRSNGSANLVGRFLFIDNLKTKTSFSGFTIRIRIENENINSKFLCHYLKTDFVRNKIITDSSGSNIKSLNQTLLSNIKIPLPPLSEQQKIVSEIEKIEEKIKVLETEISEIPKQKEAVLKKYL
jgi:restriction endonuclease S subunit